VSERERGRDEGRDSDEFDNMLQGNYTLSLPSIRSWLSNNVLCLEILELGFHGGDMFCM